jgi:hypothetical protein
VYRNRCGTLPDVYDPLMMYMSNDQFLGSNIATVTPPTSTHYQQGWSTIPIYKGVTGNPLYMPKFTDISGNINFGSNILAAHILFNSFESYTAQLNVDSIFHGLYERPKISINFDDCFSSAYNIGHQECIRRGMKSTAFASFRTVGTADPNYMTVSQFQTLAANPLIEIGLHSDKRFDGGGSQILATPAQEIAANIAGIAALGVPMVPYGAWPEGQYRQDDPTIALEPIRAAGIKGMRSTYRGYTIFNSGCYNPYSIGSVDLSQAHTVAQIKSIVDACVAYGLSMSFNAHKIVDSGSLLDGLTYLTADYVEILDYIATKRAAGLLDVVFFSEMIEKSPTPLASF